MRALAGGCCGLNVCIPPPQIHRDPTARCDSFRRWGLWEVLNHEGGALRVGISALTNGNFFSCSPWLEIKWGFQTAPQKLIFTISGVTYTSGVNSEF